MATVTCSGCHCSSRKTPFILRFSIEVTRYNQHHSTSPKISPLALPTCPTYFTPGRVVSSAFSSMFLLVALNRHNIHSLCDVDPNERLNLSLQMCVVLSLKPWILTASDFDFHHSIFDVTLPSTWTSHHVDNHCTLFNPRRIHLVLVLSVWKDLQ